MITQVVEEGSMVTLCTQAVIFLCGRITTKSHHFCCCVFVKTSCQGALLSLLGLLS